MREAFQRIELTTAEVEELYKMLKELEEEEAVVIPAWNDNHSLSQNSYFARGSVDDHRFKITLQRKGRVPEEKNLSICFFDAETNNCLGRLDLGKNLQPHRNRDGSLLNGPHFHYYPDGMDRTMTFDEFLEDAGEKDNTISSDNFVSILILFMCYINLDRKGTPVTEALL